MWTDNLFPDRITEGRSEPRLATARKWGLAVKDIGEGLKAHHIWVITGWQDIRMRYKRSTIGPFWITLSLGITVAAMGALYARLFHEEVADYIPYLSIGMIVWAFISTLVMEGCTVFIQAEGIIKQIRLPFSMHVLRMIWRNLIIFFHNSAVLVFVYLWFSIAWRWQVVLVPLGLLVIALNAMWLGLILGTLSARFRDIPQIVTSLMQVLFFVTPVMWRVKVLKNHMWIAKWNPAYNLMKLVMRPLQGRLPSEYSLIFVAVMTVLGWGVALAFFSRFRARIAYWI